jgi:cytohesin
MRHFLFALGLLLAATPASAGFYELLDAARANDLATACAELAAGTEPNGGPSGFPESYTPLQWAAHHGNVALIDLLLAAGADTERRDFNGDRPMLWAARAGRAESIVALVAAGSPVDSVADPYGLTPLMLAARSGSRDAVRALLLAGANPDARDQGGGTALHEAALAQDANSVGLLLAAGADPDAADGILRSTPLHLAVLRQSTSIVRQLLEAGANPIGWDSDGKDPLHLAALIGLPDNVAALLEAGADPIALDSRGLTPLDWAIKGKRHQAWDNDAAGVLLVPFATDVSQPFSAAVAAGMTRTATALLARGADRDAPSVLANAALLEDPALLTAIIAAGADLDVSGTDALVSAASAGRIANATLLLDLGVPIDLAGSIDISPVLAAAQAGQLDMLRFLLARGAIPIDPERVRLAQLPIDQLLEGGRQSAVYDWDLHEARLLWEDLLARQREARAILAAAIAAR